MRLAAADHEVAEHRVDRAVELLGRGDIREQAQAVGSARVDDFAGKEIAAREALAHRSHDVGADGGG